MSRAHRPGSILHGGPPAGRPDPVRRPETATVPQRSKRAWLLALLTLFIPGAAQVVAGNRGLGRAALRVTLTVWLLAVVAVVLLLVRREWLIRILGTNWVQLVAIGVLAALAVGWLILWVDTLRLMRLNLVAPGMTPLVALVTVALMVVTSGGLGFGAYAVNAGRNAINEIFQPGEPIDPVAGRYNFLLMGGDAGEGRVGLRPDSIHVASVNAETGSTILFSIPRNFQNAQFTEDSPLWQAYPTGFDCGDECIINHLYVDVTRNHQDLYPDAEDPGAEAMMDAAGGILGLEIQSYALVDMGGFAQLIDSMGGVTVTSGGWTTYRGTRPDGEWGNAWWGPGTYTFDGDDALAFARSRHWSTDYSRIQRQQCIQSAMLAQFNPQTLVTRFQGILDAGQQVVETDLPGQQVGAFVALASQAQSQGMGRLTIGPPDFQGEDGRFTTYPDFDEIHSRVNSLLAEDGTPQAGSAGVGGAGAGNPLPLLSALTTRTQATAPQAGSGSAPSGEAGSDPDEWPAPPLQPDGDEINEGWLMFAEDTGQDRYLEEAASTNHLCTAGG